MVDQFIISYFCQTWISKIIEKVLETLDPEFLNLVAPPQFESVEAAQSMLQPFDISSADKVVYMGILKCRPGLASTSHEIWRTIAAALCINNIVAGVHGNDMD